MPNSIDKMCGVKAKFLTKKFAIRRSRTIGKQYMKAYRCPHCDYWHLTRGLSRKLRNEQLQLQETAK